MTEVYEQFEHAGVIVEIVHDDSGLGDPQENDNAGKIYSWSRDFSGDEQIREPEIGLTESERLRLNELLVIFEEAGGRGVEIAEEIDELRAAESLEEYMGYHYDAALTIPLFFSPGRSEMDSIYECDDDDANCALVFTQEEIDEEWSGHVAPYPIEMKNADGNLSGEVREYVGARSYAKGRIKELDDWFQGNVWGIVIKQEIPNAPFEIELSSIWGYIGDPNDTWIRDEAKELAGSCADELNYEAGEAAYWAARGVVTV